MKLTCQSPELGYAEECEEQATKTIKVDGEKYEVCQDCYDTADTYRMARWADYYRNR